MESSPSPTTTKYQQVTVDVPEDRIAEFHRFFGRFLAVRPGRGRRGRYGRAHRSGHERRCGERREATEHSDTATEHSDTTAQQAGTTDV
ncbi:MAG: hypothetical protein M3018_05300 [Actinomycetota bacterium]|nr:hypothetical protein [Actinomycetota bacterium]